MTKNNKYWLRSGIINIFQNFSGVILGFGSFFFLIRILDRHSFGAWTLFMSTITILEIIRTGLIQNALIQFIASTGKKEHPEIKTASFFISAVLTTGCIIIISALAHILAELWDTPELSNMLYLYNIAFFFSGILNIFNNIDQAHLKFRGVFLSSTLRLGLFFIYVFTSFIFEFEISLMSLVYVQIASVLLSTVVAYYSVKESLILAKTVSKVWIKKLVTYGKYAFGTSVSSILSGTIDQMMLGGLLSPAASGSFNIAVRTINLIDIPTNAMATIVFPQSARRMETDGKAAVKYLYEKSVGTILAILLPGLLFIFVFTDLVIYVIAGEKYTDIVPLFRITLLYCVLIPYGRQFGTIISSIGKPKTSFYIVLITASLNLILNYFFISKFGLMGAAYATLLSNVIGFFLAQRILSKELNVKVLNTFIFMIKFYPEFFKSYIVPFFYKSSTKP